MPEETKSDTPRVPLSRLTAALRLQIARWSAQQAPVWVVAEVAKCKRHSSGHCYLTLVGEVRRGSSRPDRRHVVGIGEAKHSCVFEQAAGAALSPGNTVRARGQVQFHPCLRPVACSFGY